MKRIGAVQIVFLMCAKIMDLLRLTCKKMLNKNSDNKNLKRASGEANRDLALTFAKESLLNFMSTKNKITTDKGDIETIKYAEEFRNFYESIIASMPNNIYWLDRNCVLLGGNDNLARMFGLKSHTELIGLTYEQMSKLANWTEGQGESFKQAELEVMTTGVAKLNVDEPPFTVDGKTKHFMSSKVPLYNLKREIIGVLGISVDITGRKKMEEDLLVAMQNLEAANKAKSEFLANMSHDVKTPLSGIIALSELLKFQVPEKYRDLPLDITQAGQNLLTFFENCIELSKLERGSISSSEESFSLKHLVNEILSLFRPAMKAKGLVMNVEYSEKIPSRLLGNRINLYRTLLNLMGNAIKFTTQGSISIRVQLSENSTPEKAIIKLTITDTGIGIPKDKQGIIFEQFSRVTPSYEGTYEGSGIGLYIVQKFVKSMGGEVCVKSDEGKGSQFTVVIPFQVALLTDSEYEDEEEANSSQGNLKQAELNESNSASSALQEAEIQQLSLSNILLVEDNLMAQKGARALLNSLGCHVDIADRGEKAINLFQAGKYDLVFMDIGLPDMKGYQVATHLREIEDGTSFHVPILGLSAHATQEEKQLSTAATMADMLSKPLLHDQAKAVLEKYVMTVKHAGEDTSSSAMEDSLKIIALERTSNPSEKERMAWEILNNLIATLPTCRAEMGQAYKAGRIDLLLEIVHKLHGGLCYTNTPHFLQTVQSLERNLRSGDHHQLNALYADALQAMDLCEKTYNAMKQMEVARHVT